MEKPRAERPKSLIQHQIYYIMNGFESQENGQTTGRLVLDKDIKVRTREAMTKRKTHKLRHGDIIDVEEYHDGNYGAPGKKRIKKEKPTPEQMQKVNAMNKARRCRLKMLEYINPGDCFATWTYSVENRPLDMDTALKDFQKALKKVRREYKKQGRELFWFRNIQRGTKGAWHIHLVVNEIGGTTDILRNAWPHGGIYSVEIRKSIFYDEDFTKLANYMTKDENTVELKADGKPSKPRIKESNYNTSRNMPITEPEVDRLVRWKSEPKPKKGYYIAKIHEGNNPVTGYKYRRYTMIKLAKEQMSRDLVKTKRNRGNT